MPDGYEGITEEKVLSVDEGIQLKERVIEAAATPQWRWMGNYGSVYDVVAVANSAGCKAGALITLPDSNGLFPTWMFY